MTAIAPIGALTPLSATSTSPIGSSDPFGSVGSIGSTGSSFGAGSSSSATGASPTGSFVDTIGTALRQLNGDLTAADSAAADFAAGGSADLHTVLLQMQEASIGLQFGTQIQSHLVDAYHQIMQMQL